MPILVCGGAGYIGSHFVEALQKTALKPVVVDNLRTGHREAVPDDVPFYETDIRDKKALQTIFAKHNISAVVHFAACSLVGESMEEPLLYFNNNVGGMQSLLEVMAENDVDKIVFSSSASTYGEPKSVPILETAPTNPTNPYGESKLFMEKMMHWIDTAFHIRYVSLRYFNVAGASPTGNIGEDHRPESHLVPIILQVPLGKRSHLTVYGNDYPTPDGTCIRDYVHVCDLASAHIAALHYLEKGGKSDIFNLGSGNGFSVMEMITAARRATGHAIPIEIGTRRPGDPARLIASSEKAKKILGWQPQATNMEDIISSAWKWHSQHPNGFAR